MMEGTVLRVFIPAQNPAGTVTVQTREQLEMPSGTLKISLWAYASSSGGTIQAFFGSVFGSALTIQQGINRYEWTFSVSSGAKGKIGFKVTGRTTTGTTVYLDGASASLWGQANTLLRPVGSQEDFVSTPPDFPFPQQLLSRLARDAQRELLRPDDRQDGLAATRDGSAS
jgi:hypothetical protein